MSFLKSLFKKKSKKYNQYTGGDIKIIAMKARIILETQLAKLQKQVEMESRQMTEGDRNILVTFVSRAAECECLKIIVELIRRVEDSSERIANCGGNMAQLKSELAGIQSVLWLNKTKNNLDFFFQFCDNYFKGKDIGSDFAVTLETYRLFPILKCFYPSEPVTFETQIGLMKPFLSNYFSPKKVQQLRLFLKEKAEKAADFSLGFNRYPIKHLESQSEPIYSYEEKKMEQPKSKVIGQPTLPPSGNISLIIPEESQLWELEESSPKRVIQNPVRIKIPQKSKYSHQDLLESQVNLLPANHEVEQPHDKIPAQKYTVMPDNKAKEAPSVVQIEPVSRLEYSEEILAVKMFQWKEALREVAIRKEDWRERDEIDSLEFINRVLGKAKTLKKKSYMVSIYAREQYLEKIQSAK